MEELKSRIVDLNVAKNNYATKKMKGSTIDADDKELVSSLIYVIAECRRVASDLGVSDDGKINRDEPGIEIFKILNENVKELKDQIVMLTKSTSEELKKVIRDQADKQHVEETEKIVKGKPRGKDEKVRQAEIRDRLRNTLNDKQN